MNKKVKCLVTVGTLAFDDSTFEKGAVFEVSAERAAKFERSDVKILTNLQAEAIEEAQQTPIPPEAEAPETIGNLPTLPYSVIEEQKEEAPPPAEETKPKRRRAKRV
jgi:hypothetical protein